MVQALFPLIDGITAVILSGLEALKGYFGMKIAEYNNNIRKITLDDPSPKRPIGFYCDNQEEEDE